MNYCICIKNKLGDFIIGHKYKYEIHEVLERSDDIFTVFLGESEFYFVRERFSSNFEDIKDHRDNTIRDILNGSNS